MLFTEDIDRNTDPTIGEGDPMFRAVAGCDAPQLRAPSDWGRGTTIACQTCGVPINEYRVCWPCWYRKDDETQQPEDDRRQQEQQR